MKRREKFFWWEFDHEQNRVVALSDNGRRQSQEGSWRGHTTENVNSAVALVNYLTRIEVEKRNKRK